MPGLMMKYFVLNPRSRELTYARASRAAMRTYARMIAHENPEMAAELRAWADSVQSEALDQEG